MDGAIRFLLNGVPRALTTVAPNTSVLSYLRETELLCGTKDGCSTGGCGACTVALAELSEDGLHYRSVNACNLPVTELHGKLLVTIEGLAGKDGRLHPVQAAILRQHGTQCGYCTPGVAMSLFCLNHRKRGNEADDAEVIRSLSGNICRCTGYRPLLAAARDIADGSEDWYLENEHRLAEQLRDHVGATRIVLETEDWRFVASRSLTDVLDELKSNPEATLICGGTASSQSRARTNGRATVVSIADVAELRKVETAVDTIEIGAAVPYEDMLPVFDRTHPDLAALIRRLGCQQTRNRGTLGGAIGQKRLTGDVIAGLLVLGADVVLRSPDDERSVSLDTYNDEPDLRCRTGEVITRIKIPLCGPDEVFRTYKVSIRRDLALPVLTSAYYARVRDGRIQDARIAYSGLNGQTVRLKAFEQAVSGLSPSVGLATDTLDDLAKSIHEYAVDDESSAYARSLAVNLLKRFLAEIAHADQPVQVAAL